MIEIISIEPFLLAGIFGSIGKVFGFGNDDASDAAEEIALQNAIARQGIENRLKTTERDVRPFIGAGRDALSEVVEGSTIEGLNNRLRQIFDTDVFTSLADERRGAVQSGLSAAGLTRSGAGIDALAQIPSEIGLAIENLLTGRSGALAQAGQGAAFGLGNFGLDAQSRIGGIRQDTGQARASGILGDAQATASGLGNLFGGIGAGISSFAGPDSILSGVGSALSFFSDRRLKENVVKAGKIGDLSVYTWDWIEVAKGTMVEACSRVGFMADEVKEKYPQFVSDYCGIDVINYPALLNKLEAR